MRTLAELLSTPLTTETEAEVWVQDMHAIGYGFHPDDSAATVVVGRTGEPLFNAHDAALADARMSEAFALLDDVYGVSLDAVGGHDCWDHAVPYVSDGPLGHGWECGLCGAFLQAG